MLRPALTLLSAGLLSAMLVTGCGVRFDDGPSATQTRSVAPFQRVTVNGSTDVNVRLGDRTSVVVHGGRTVIDDVRTEVRDGTLVVERTDDDTLTLGGDDLRVDVVVPRVDAAEVHGSGDLDVDLDGRTVDALDLAVQGSGDVHARGRVGTLHAAINGSGDLQLRSLRADDAAVSVQGSGDADLRVERALDATIDGSGDIDYAGDPEVRSDVAGSGDLSRVD